MNTSLIGRKEEQELLKTVHASRQPEFLVLYGRRRVGKTFLIRQFFARMSNTIFFNSTGTKDGSLGEQIAHFTQAIGETFLGGISPQPGKNWDETFRTLTKTIDSVPKNKKVVLFFDELPWMATRNSNLLQSLDYYWNQYWSNDSRIKLIVCGSSASWIINKIINDKGGLHNRITQKMQLNPFNLRETSEFLTARGNRFTHRQVLQLYMVMGGIPYYLAAVPKGNSVPQVIEKLAFRQNGILLDEFDNLFSSLFTDAAPYIELLRIIAGVRNGVSVKNILEKSDEFSKGGRIAERLEDLKRTGFILSFKPYAHAKKGLFYRVIDEFTLFHFYWMEPLKDTLQASSLEPGYWQGIHDSPAWHSWSGYAFEAVCFKHLSAIRKKLEIPPTAIAGSWRHVPNKGTDDDGAQIDLLFDRRDGVTTLCEIKYAEKPFVIDKQYARSLVKKTEVFAAKTKTEKQITTAMVCAGGLKENLYSDDLISGTVSLEDFFGKG